MPSSTSPQQRAAWPASALTTALATVLAIVGLVACSSTPPPANVDSTPTATAAPRPDSRPAPDDTADEASGFSTKLAYYEPSRFQDLPGWNTDNVAESWDAFRKGCTVIGNKDGWSSACAAARNVDGKSATAVRRFFENQFAVYQIHNLDRSASGTLTGYYEPLLSGSKTYGEPYVYPVYGTPDDMLFLDTRRLPKNAATSRVAARVEGKNVVPLTTVSTGNLSGVYALDLHEAVPDVRDKRLRLRIEGNRIVPYYTRLEIEKGILDAPVLAYVDDPVTLYSMQLQGSGKITMKDGSVVRLAYAEQNGYPSKPPLAASTTPGKKKIVVRGMEIDVGEEDIEVDEAASPLLTRGFKLAGAPAGVPGARITRTSTGRPVAVKRTVASSDPSYVFFRQIPDSPGGPIGALGVQLSAGRSVAVDPRTTPLGAPVFLATRDKPTAPGAVNKLVMAQDMGGAIRGPVRADYFHGFGRQAQAAASRMKDRAEMWVLLPKGMKLAAQNAGVRVRGTPVVAAGDCLVEDPELCVNDGQ